MPNLTPDYGIQNKFKFNGLVFYIELLDATMWLILPKATRQGAKK
jgi:hypothetical protein